MDSDDISKLNRCEKQVEAFHRFPELSIVGSSVDEFYDTLDVIVSRRIVPIRHKDIYKFAKRRSAFNHPSVMFRKSAVQKIGGYSNLRRNQDVDLLGRMLFSGCKAANFKESLVFFRADKDLAKRRKSWENTKSYIDVIYKFWKMGYSRFWDFFIVTSVQIGVFLMPINLQQYIYIKFLRG